jgi:hypothetical protein
LRARRLRGFAFSLEALLALASLGLLALALARPAPPPSFAPVRVALAAGDAAEVLVQNPEALPELDALAGGSGRLLRPRIERLAGTLGVCLVVRSGAGSAEAGCGGGRWTARAVRTRAFWSGGGFREFSVEARA